MVNRDSSFSETHREPQRKPKADGRTAIQTEEWEARREEWMMRRGRADVWGPPCLPTMSSSPLFPHLSVSLPPALLRFLLFCCYFSPLPLFLSVCFFLSSFGDTRFFTLCFYSCLFAALHLFSRFPSFQSSFLISSFILFMYTAQILLSVIFNMHHVKVTILKILVLVDLATLVVSGVF